MSFCVDSGEIIGVVGPNGAGKSTLMKLLSGNIKPDTGGIFIDDKELHSMNGKERAKRISYMPQDLQTPFPYTVEEVVEMGLFSREGISKEEKERIIREAIDMSGIFFLRKRPITELSGGERKLVFLAKIFTQNAGVILLDEASANLDIKHTANLLSALSKSSKENKKTVIAIIHDINIASRSCDKIIMIDKCNWIGPNPPGEIINHKNLEKFYDIDKSSYNILSNGLVEVAI